MERTVVVVIITGTEALALQIQTCMANDKARAYKLFNLHPNSSKEKIREAYLEQIKQCHPDVSHAEDANSITVKLNAAYEELMRVSRSFLQL